MPTSHPLLWRCKACNHSPLTEALAAINCSNCGHQYVLQKGIWECEDGFTPSSFSANRSTHLQNIEHNHFWFAARDRLLRTRLLALKHPEEQKLLELGCGSGRILASLTDDFTQTVGIEGHLGALERAVETCPNSHLLHSNVLCTPLTKDQFDWVVAFDVLEHVEPAAFLNEAFRLTRPGGRLLISVPAFPLLWSYVDKAAGHRCRYRLKSLTKELENTGWRLHGHTHFQFLLFPLLAITRLLNRHKQSQLERNPPGIINKILGKINQLEVNLFHRLSLPFGSSLIVWAEKPIITMTEHNERTTQH